LARVRRRRGRPGRAGRADLGGASHPRSRGGPVRCDYWQRAECRSCALIETPRPRQLADKERRARAAVGARATWSPPFAGPEAAFRNKAKMVVGGTTEAPTLGILDAEQR